MSIDYRRRSVLQTAAAIGCGLMSGCVLFPEYAPGTVIIQNDHTLSHKVLLTVKNDQKRQKTVTVKPENTVTLTKFIAEPGTYDVTVATDTGEQDTITDYKVPRKPDKGDCNGWVEVTITTSNDLLWSIACDDNSIL